MISLPLAAILASAVLATSFLSGIFGMAGGMILMGILLAIMPLAAAMVLHGVTQMASNGWRAWLWRGHIRWRVVALYCAGAAVPTLAFALLRVSPSAAIALIIIGLLPFVGLALPDRCAPDASRGWQGVACGAICTALQLLAGVSGPVLDVFFVGSSLDRRAVVATKAAAQTFGHLLKVAYFGQFLTSATGDVAPAALVLAVALAFIGTQLSRRVLDVISEAQFRRWTRGLIAAIAAVYLVQGFSLVMADLRAGAEANAATSVSLQPDGITATTNSRQAESARPDVQQGIRSGRD